MTLRAFAARHGYLFQKQPPALGGEGEEAFGVPLSFDRGWLWDAGPNVGVHVVTKPADGKKGIGLLAAKLACVGFREQTRDEENLLGWISMTDWDLRADVYEALLFPRRAAASPEPQEAAANGPLPEPKKRSASRRAPGAGLGAPRIQARNGG